MAFLDLQLAIPKEMGGPGGPKTNPEELFAAGYSACFLSALKHVAAGHKVNIHDASVTAKVGIGPNDAGRLRTRSRARCRAPESGGGRRRDRRARGASGVPVFERNSRERAGHGYRFGVRGHADQAGISAFEARAARGANSTRSMSSNETLATDYRATLNLPAHGVSDAWRVAQARAGAGRMVARARHLRAAPRSERGAIRSGSSTTVRPTRTAICTWGISSTASSRTSS